MTYVRINLQQCADAMSEYDYEDEYDDNYDMRPLLSMPHGASIFNGRTLIARFNDPRDALDCLEPMSRAMGRNLRMVNHGPRLGCRLPEYVFYDDGEFITRNRI